MAPETNNHYFDVSLNPATGLPLWTAKSHVDLDGRARKIDGRWLLTHAAQPPFQFRFCSGTPDAHAVIAKGPSEGLSFQAINH